MSASLLEALNGLVTPSLLKTATSTLGESESALTSGLGAIVSKILGALVSGSGDSSLMNSIAGLVSSQARDTGALADVAGLLTGSAPVSIAGNQLIGALFGVREGGIAQTAAAAASLKPQSGAALMALAGPLVLGALGKVPGGASLTGTALSSLLNTERASLLGNAPAASAAPVRAAAPAPAAAPSPAPAPAAVKAPAPAATQSSSPMAAAAAAAAAATSVAASASSAARSETIRSVSVESTGGLGLSWLLWFIPLVILGAAGWYVWNEQQFAPRAQPAAERPVEKKSEAPAAAPVIQAALAPAPAPEPAQAVAVDAGNGMLKLALASGDTITYAKHGVESQLIGFLQDANSVIDKKTWFNFDRLNFETGSTNLTAESKDQVSNIAAVLRAFPTSSIKIGGYTDNVGQPENNLKLSDDRAKKVMEELAAMGIDAGRLQAEGYGEQFPVAENDTDEGRAKNRRTAVSVRAR